VPTTLPPQAFTLALVHDSPEPPLPLPPEDELEPEVPPDEADPDEPPDPLLDPELVPPFWLPPEPDDPPDPELLPEPLPDDPSGVGVDVLDPQARGKAVNAAATAIRAGILMKDLFIGKLLEEFGT
jgi:hypothetical protein